MKKNLTRFLSFLIFGLFSNMVSAQNPYLRITHGNGNFSTIEGNSISLRLTLSGAITTQVVVDITTISGTAGTSDFTSLSTTITIPAGQTSSSYFSVTTTNDALIETNENFWVNALAVSGNTSNVTSQQTITILDNDTVPTVTASSQTSGTEGVFSPTVYYSLSAPYNANVVINCVTATGTAGASDFTAVNSSVTIPAGQTSVTKVIAITNDALVEPDETFVLNGTVTSGNTTNTSFSTTILIIDNDTTPTLNTYNGQVTEGQTASAFVALDRVYNSNVVVNFVTTTGTAGTSDYTTTNITQTILAGNFAASVSIPTTNDTLDEPVEKFYVNANVTSSNTTTTLVTSEVTIIDNDGLPDLSVYHYNDSPVNQGAGNYEGDVFSFNLYLSAPNTADTVVHVVTSPGTASNTDFTPVNTTVTIPAGETYVEVQVPTTLDNLQEGTENFTFTATVTSGNTYNLSNSSVADILDNYNVKAYPDTFTFVAGTGSNLSVIANDLFHGAAATSSDVSFAIDTNTIGATINAQGILTVPASTLSGFYYLTYTACEIANPGICDTSYIYLEIASPLTLTFTSAYADTNGDGYTSAGDTLNIVFTVSNIGNAPITNIQPDTNLSYNITYSGGPIASLAAGTTNSTTITGQIIVTQENINYGGTGLVAGFAGNYYSDILSAVIDSSVVINPSDGIRLKAFVDSNNNGVQDGIEPDFKYGNFDFTINGGVVHNIYCQSSYYIYESNPATIYHLSYNIDTPYATYNSCPIIYANVTITPGSGITTYNFPIATTPYQDLSAYLIPFDQPRPGVVWENYIVYGNYSNQPVASGTVTYTKDSNVTITNISEVGATTTASGFTFNFANLAPYETRYMNVELLVPPIPTVALGQLLTNSVAITMPSGDIYPYNNGSSLSQIIVGSFDPNDITESHGEIILFSSFTSNDYLTYTIRFENTGTANAINIRIEDVLNAKLDPETIRMIDSNVPYLLDRVGANLTWRFNGINLPPSVPDTRIGKGYLTFQIKPKPGYAVGDVIPNSASIYFDTNPAIITNTFNTRFVNALVNEDFTFSNFSYFPNPVRNTLNISNDSIIDEVSITSTLGQQIFTKKINSIQAEIDVSALSKGVYFIKISSQGLEKTSKIIKE
jgi:hypothetical protein